MIRSLYLHIPFCVKRCTYCDFYTEAVSQDDTRMDSYLEHLIQSIRAASKAGYLEQVRTLYIGGGTPTHFGHSRLVELAYLLSLTIRMEQVKEYTLEANPESLHPSLLRDVYALGVNRLSVGVQSFVDSELTVLGRAHDVAQAVQALQEARERFDNISLDLICGIPGQTTQSWQHSLEQALYLEPEHLSIYPLQIEENTPLAHMIGRKEHASPDEDTQAEFMEQANSVLVSGGYHRYEVASYAKPGRESMHNCTYWNGISYLGIGSGAASMFTKEDGTRERWVEGEEPELLTAKEAVAEDIILAMRMSAGISREYLVKAKLRLPQVLEVFSELQQLGLVMYRDDTYLPTNKGWLLGNELYLRIWDLAKKTQGT